MEVLPNNPDEFQPSPSTNPVVKVGSKVATHLKAIFGAVIAAAGVAELALADDVITYAEWLRVGSTLLATYGAVWGVPYTPGMKR
jgi:hypothetical protein